MICVLQSPFPVYLAQLGLHSFAVGKLYHHSMFHNPTAAMNLFHVGKQYQTFCKAEASVTHNFIGRKIISNVKHSDARNSLPILDVKRSSDKRHSASKYCKWTLRQTTGVCYTRIYVLGAPPHFPTEYRHEAAVVSREHRMKWVVVLGDGYPWPLPWECKLGHKFTPRYVFPAERVSYWRIILRTRLTCEFVRNPNWRQDSHWRTFCIVGCVHAYV